MAHVITPMQRQYHEIKEKHADALLFFRLGDFYELFYEDAIEASRALGLTLTSRHKKTENEMKMCGVPYHSADKYLAKLTQKGFKVAICEQVSDPKLPGIVKREVVRIVTPGTTFQNEVLDEKSNNYIASIVEKNNDYAVSYADITTGELYVTKVTSFDAFQTELTRIKPVEVLIPQNLFSESDVSHFLLDSLKTNIGSYECKGDAKKYLLKLFQLKNLECFQLEKEETLISAVSNLVAYLEYTQKTDLSHISGIKKYSPFDFMVLDGQTIRNLELLSTIYDGRKEGSLLNVIDKTYTSVGGRCLRNILLQPLIKKDDIERRLRAVEEIYENSTLREDLLKLKDTFDLERIIAKLSCDHGSARDLVALKHSLNVVKPLYKALQKKSSKALQSISKTLSNSLYSDIQALIDTSIVDEPPMTLREGKMIREGYNKEIDEYRTIMNGGKEWLEKYQVDEKERTGISTLKVGFNKVFGYYIEISKGQAQNAPDDYVRKQTLTNAERFITPILKEYEEKVLSAEEKIIALEYEVFQEIRSKVLEHIEAIQKLANSIGLLDVYRNFADLALENNYIKPEFSQNGALDINNGRHPVIETMMNLDDFVPNNTKFSQKEGLLHLITGPNMAGKSTYLRQNALIILLAQIGSFVPAEKAIIPITDRIFTRIGASDNLSKGQSTFMVEMQETAHILHNATNKSFIILDEIGRGTSTYDGLSLAWAIFEHIHETIRAKTLFATHYHELVELTESLKDAANYNVAVTENSQGVVFLRKVVSGGADESYGIEVAKLAGLPKEIIKKANDVLQTLEDGNNFARQFHPQHTSQKKEVPEDQLSFFAPKVVEKIIEKKEESKVEKAVQSLEIEKMTPLEALNALHELKKDC